MPFMAMQHDVDPRDKLLASVGDLSQFELFGNKVLIAVYERPNVTKSGIHLADATVQEDRYQGKAGLVVALGPTAFLSDSNYDFMGQKVQVGDWVAVFVSDGRKLVVNKTLCRIVDDTDIRLKIPAPDVVY